MTDYVVRDTQLTSVADAIRAKGGTSDPLAFPDGFVSAVEAFPNAVTLDSLSVTENGVYTPSSGHAFSEVTVDVAGGGDTSMEDGIIARTISGSYTNERVTRIGYYAFESCTQLENVNFPACISIYNYAFSNCTALSTVSFPACTLISNYVFQSCEMLSSVMIPACERIGIHAFESCHALSVVNFPECRQVRNYAFAACSRLSAVDFPACTDIQSSAFMSCSNLLFVSFPKCVILSGSAFYECYRLISAYFLGSSVPQLQGSTVFWRTPINGYNTFTTIPGSIFVRESMLEAFQSAAYWSYFASRMVGLTDEEIAALDAQEGT